MSSTAEGYDFDSGLNLRVDMDVLTAEGLEAWVGEGMSEGAGVGVEVGVRVVAFPGGLSVCTPIANPVNIPTASLAGRLSMVIVKVITKLYQFLGSWF
jgi:hypothetical protein